MDEVDDREREGMII